MSGLIGSKLPAFKLFGDSMNTSSRMESTGACASSAGCGYVYGVWVGACVCACVFALISVSMHAQGFQAMRCLLPPAWSPTMWQPP